MVDHFAGHAALKVKDQGHTPQLAEHAADQGPLVQVRVNDVRLDAQHGTQAPEAKHHVEVKLVPGRADNDPIIERNSPTTDHVQPGNVSPIWIGQNGDPVTEFAQAGRLFQDAHVCPIVGKEHGWGQHQDIVRSGFLGRPRTLNAHGLVLSSSVNAI